MREEHTPENKALHNIAAYEKFNGFFTCGVRFDGGDISAGTIIRVGDAVQAFKPTDH